MGGVGYRYRIGLRRGWRSRVLLGIVFGLVTYAIMNLIVVPVRFDAPLPPSPRSIGTQLFAHVVLVGIPMALIAARYLKPRTA